MLKACTVFHGGAIVAEGDAWLKDMPQGAYVRYEVMGLISWYRIRWGSNTPINASDVPNDIRLIMLLLEVPV